MTPEKKCKNCDFENAVKKGRAWWFCPKCGRDFSLEYFLWYQVAYPEKLTTNPMNPIHQFNEREENNFNLFWVTDLTIRFVMPKIAAKLGDASVVDIEENIKSHLQASNKRAMQFVLDRVREGVGADAQSPYKYPTELNEHYISGINAEKARTRQLLNDLSALIEQK